MNESIVVRNTGTVSRPRRTNPTLSMLKSLLSSRELQLLAKAGGRNLYSYLSQPAKNKSESSAASTLAIRDFPVPVSKGYEAVRRGPNSTPTKGGGVRVRHRELLDSSLVGASTWTQLYKNEYEINPGLSGTFPWLSTIAKNYTEYRVHGLSFDYVPSCPTTTPGDVILTPLYDPQIPTPVSEVEASDQIDTKSGSVFMNHRMILKPSKMNISGTKKLIRDYAMAGSIVNYDCGRVCVSTTSGSGGAIGKLFITYDIELFAPRLVRKPSITGWPENFVQYQLNADTVLASGVALNLSQSVASVDPSANNLDITASPTAFIAPYGIYRVRYQALVQFDNACVGTIATQIIGSGMASPPTTYQKVATSSGGDLYPVGGEFVWNNTPEGVSTVNTMSIRIVATSTVGGVVISLVRGLVTAPYTCVQFWLL